MTTTTTVSPTFASADRASVESIECKKADLKRARKLTPALVSALVSEITTCEAALERARAAALDFDGESREFARAEAQRRQALTALNTSTEIDPDAAMAIVLEAERAKYLEGARKRRADAARDAASSAYGRAAKDIADRNAAVNFAERLAGAVIDRELNRVQPETRPGVIAWLPLVFPIEGRAAYARAYEYRDGHPSYDRPPPIEEYIAECQRVFAGVARTREQAAQLATDLAAVAAE